ncbi:MAG TPA: glucose-6-phosphate isomerase [Burkholderiales bacterium]|nr:glucose-6-phosphate isomerase [Burkholderiales bacterium]
MHLTERRAWKDLAEHARAMASVRILDLFERDPRRAVAFSLEACGLLFDYSRHPISDETRRLLLALAEDTNLAAQIGTMFEGRRINVTEKRAVLHTALRNRSDRPVLVDGEDVMPGVREVLGRMKGMAERVRGAIARGATGKAFTDVVNIGIGGSDLGPLMVTAALRPYGSPRLRVHFVSNVDGAHLAAVLSSLNPESTLFIVSSKTFTTQETLANARSARQWLLTKLASAVPADVIVEHHFAAVSTNLEATAAFGIIPERVFGFWDWVGGRYSLWSAIGLPIALAAGFDNFEELLRGGFEMDEHFRTMPLDRNLPVIAGLLGVWHIDFLGHPTHAILPYAQDLLHLPAFLQQLDMESNGKRVDRGGRTVDYATGPVIWGAPGTNGQHAFFQHLHQGTQVTPADFIVAANPVDGMPGHHDMLLANCIAQTEALLRGKTEEEVRAELAGRGMQGEELERLTPHRIFPGNRPSSTIVLHRLDPRSLGALIAFYEHKVFVQGAIWNINSFDQWGVELGKQLAGGVLEDLKAGRAGAGHDPSTRRLIQHVLDQREGKEGRGKRKEER